MKKTIALDLGGTNVNGALLEGTSIIQTKKKKTKAEEGVDAVVEQMIDVIESLLEKGDVSIEDIAGVAVAVPGMIDKKLGTILFTPNIGFNNFPLVKKLQNTFEVSILLENDVNAGTYGEFVAGAAKGADNVLGIFPGTGIGGGLIINGRLYRGSGGNAGEVGHMIIQTDGPLCNCGQYGCLEALASRTSISKDAVALAGSGKAPVIYEEAGTDFKNYKSKVFETAYLENDSKVVRVVERAAHFLGIGIANCINILNPEIVVIGGGLIERLGAFYLKSIEQSMEEHALPSALSSVKLVQAALGDDAALIGGAGLLMEEDK